MIRTMLAAATVMLCATAAEARADDDYFVCRVVARFADGGWNSLSGFKVKGVNGVYTALHGVAHAESITAFFHDPKTRRVELRLVRADVARDVALLEPANANLSLPSGGLSLGIWPDAEHLPKQLSGQPAVVIGHPLDIEHLPTHTPLTLRKTPYAPLTKILNTSARTELNRRNSPNTTVSVLALEGNFLPGHSGAPILDRDGAVIGVGNGGLKEGKVGYGWAIPFHELQLESLTETGVRQQIQQLPRFRAGQSLFLVFDDSIQQPDELRSLVSTVVESDDGSPILALRNLPEQELKNELNRLKEILEAIRRGDNHKFTAAGELERIMQGRVYLPSGTPVAILSEPEKIAAPLNLPGSDSERGMQIALGHLFTKVRVNLAEDKSEDLYVPTIAIRRRSGVVVNAPNNQGVIVAGNNNGTIIRGNVIVQPPKATKKLILSNGGDATLVLKEDVDDILPAAVEPQNHLGIVPHGTGVELLDGRKMINPVVVFRKVRILSGELKGKRGWVSQNTIREVESLATDPDEKPER